MSSKRLDVENQLSSNQAFTNVAAVSADSYKKQTAAQDLSIGRRMGLLIFPTVNAGAGTVVKIEAIQADDAALTSNVDSCGTIEILAADFIKGKEFTVNFRQGSMKRQYLGARVTCTGGTATASADIYFGPTDESPQYKSFTKVNDAAV